MACRSLLFDALHLAYGDQSSPLWSISASLSTAVAAIDEARPANRQLIDRAVSRIDVNEAGGRAGGQTDRSTYRHAVRQTC